jgi:hypothetical protein
MLTPMYCNSHNTKTLGNFGNDFIFVTISISPFIWTECIWFEICGGLSFKNLEMCKTVNVNADFCAEQRDCSGGKTFQLLPLVRYFLICTEV